MKSIMLAVVLSVMLGIGGCSLPDAEGLNVEGMTPNPDGTYGDARTGRVIS